jgi:RNA polymerase sigma-70 factor (ECF subfamily)
MTMKKGVITIVVLFVLVSLVLAIMRGGPGGGSFGDAETSEDDTGFLVYYDDGTSDGKKSIGGSGHAILFETPRGKWLLDRVEVFGSRYGTPQAPAEDFFVYVCDEEMKTVKEFPRPYYIFERGQERWHKIPIDAVAVPQRFYVCLSFNPGRTKGVFVHYDESVEESHSRQALPYTTGSPISGDWMIRVHLRKG